MKQLYEKLICAVRCAGDIMLTATRDDEQSVSGEEKAGSANFVTKYDIATQEYLIGEIRKLIPDAVFMAEEKDNDDSVTYAEHGFIIDPIDGTKNFINDLKHSAVSLAYLERGTVKIGIIYNPYHNEMFSSILGEGAYLNEKPIHASHRTGDDTLLVFGSSPYYKETLLSPTFRLLEKLYQRLGDIRRCGSAALDLAYLAAGRFDAFFEMILSPWDFAAGALIAKEAGCIVSDLSGDELPITKKSSVLGANPFIYGELLSICKE